MRRPWVVGALGLAATGLVTFALVAVSSAAFPGGDGTLAFVWDPDVSVSPQSCGDIFSVKPNGSGRRRLTHGCPWLYSQPAYSANGDRIVFVRSHEPFPRPAHGAGIYVMDADGSHMRRVTTSRTDADPAMSPNGRWILFDRFLKRSGRTQLFLVSSSGGRAHQLTHARGGAAQGTFSPDGREIAFAGNRSNIFIMRRDGSHKRQLTHGRTLGWYGEPDFSPNGRQLAVLCGEGDGFGSSVQICVMRADGTRMRHLTPRGIVFATDPVFSPNGRQIAFLGQRYCRPRACGNDDASLYTMRVNGSHLSRVFNLGGNQNIGSLSITWQPQP